MCFTIFSGRKDFDRDKVSRRIVSCDKPTLLTKLQLNSFAPAGLPDAQCSFVFTSESCKWAQVRFCRTGKVSWASCTNSPGAHRPRQSLCRFQDGALPGTYFGPNDQCAESIEIQFQIGTDDQLVENCLSSRVFQHFKYSHIPLHIYMLVSGHSRSCWQ